MISTHSSFLAGITAALSMIAALLFLRFFRRTRDPLFLLFSISFFLQGMGRTLTVIMSRFAEPGAVERAEGQTWLYILRLIAYLLIIIAIVLKNRSPGGKNRPRPDNTLRGPHAPGTN